MSYKNKKAEDRKTQSARKNNSNSRRSSENDDSPVDWLGRSGRDMAMFLSRVQRRDEAVSDYYEDLEYLWWGTFKRGSDVSDEEELIEKFISGLNEPHGIYEAGLYVLNHPEASASMVHEHVSKVVLNLENSRRIWAAKVKVDPSLSKSDQDTFSSVFHPTRVTKGMEPQIPMDLIQCPIHPRSEHAVVECVALRNEILKKESERQYRASDKADKQHYRRRRRKSRSYSSDRY